MHCTQNQREKNSRASRNGPQFIGFRLQMLNEWNLPTTWPYWPSNPTPKTGTNTDRTRTPLLKSASTRLQSQHPRPVRNSANTAHVAPTRPRGATVSVSGAKRGGRKKKGKPPLLRSLARQRNQWTRDTYRIINLRSLSTAVSEHPPLMIWKRWDPTDWWCRVIDVNEEEGEVRRRTKKPWRFRPGPFRIPHKSEARMLRTPPRRRRRILSNRSFRGGERCRRSDRRSGSKRERDESRSEENLRERKRKEA